MSSAEHVNTVEDTTWVRVGIVGVRWLFLPDVEVFLVALLHVCSTNLVAAYWIPHAEPDAVVVDFPSCTERTATVTKAIVADCLVHFGDQVCVVVALSVAGHRLALCTVGAPHL